MFCGITERHCTRVLDYWPSCMNVFAWFDKLTMGSFMGLLGARKWLFARDLQPT